VIVVLDYGIGNLRSAEKALRHVGADARLITHRDEGLNADAVVLPGVGAFGACMNALRSSGLDAVALDAIDRGTPFLGICVGLQMLYEGSAESPEARGLGVLSGTIERMDAPVLPQMQWNTLNTTAESRLFEGLPANPWMYFVHSYAAPVGESTAATCNYGADVTAVVQRDRLWATQFHPEKSSQNGLRLLENFVRLAVK
jgi:glutamine amidotransferase